MPFTYLKARLKLFYVFFIAAPKKWNAPQKSDILIYDVCGASYLAPYLAAYRVEVMATQGEWVNVRCLLMAIFRLYQFKGRFARAYNHVYINMVKPKIIITYVDNNPEFYMLSGCIKETTTISIQNGCRGVRAGFTANNLKGSNYHVDYMFVFSNTIGRLYNEYITGTVITLGSLRNNSVKIKNVSNSKVVLYISQYRPPSESGLPFFTLPNGTSISHQEFFSVEHRVLRFLGEWCFQNDKLLVVAGASLQASQEKFFYARILENIDWTYAPQTTDIGSYELVDASDIIVFIDSTLGYEAFARGKKIAALSCRGFDIKGLAFNFGWPHSLPDVGPFWTNKLKESLFQEIMDYLKDLTEFDWQEDRKRYINNILAFDPDNSKLSILIKQLTGQHIESLLVL